MIANLIINMSLTPSCGCRIRMLVLFFGLCCAGISHAATPVSVSFFDKVAIGGRDSVAYHHKDAIAAHKSSAGEKQYVVNYNGAKWRFASRENADLFDANPDKYKPAYGGFCANALSLGEGLVKTDGTYWQIFDHRLYLFFSAGGRKRWLHGNHAQYNRKAATAWQQITDVAE